MTPASTASEARSSIRRLVRGTATVAIGGRRLAVAPGASRPRGQVENRVVVRTVCTGA